VLLNDLESRCRYSAGQAVDKTLDSALSGKGAAVSAANLGSLEHLLQARWSGCLTLPAVFQVFRS
jgi:hypothetical protein